MSSLDPTEHIRRAMIAAERASAPRIREDLAAQYGADDVHNTEEVYHLYEILHFLAPFVSVRRRSDGARGVLQFQHSPRFYFNWSPDHDND